jgi:hypothetical protein
MKSFKSFFIEETYPMVYLDMDGVLCDFQKYFPEQWYDHIVMKSIMEKHHEEIEKFYENLEFLNGGKEIVNFLKKNRIPYSILSAPFSPYDKESIAGKKKWIKKYGFSKISAFFCKACDKWRFAKTEGVSNILVDDSAKNIREWQLSGGIGLLHTDPLFKNTLKNLENYLDISFWKI